MKTLKTFFSLCLLLLTLVHTSCKKDQKVPSLAIEKEFKGWFQLNGGPDKYFLDFTLHSDGTFTRYIAHAEAGTGTYTIINGRFNGEIKDYTDPSITYLFYALYAESDPANQGLSVLGFGTWGTKPSNSNQGTWEMIENIP